MYASGICCCRCYCGCFVCVCLCIRYGVICCAVSGSFQHSQLHVSTVMTVTSVLHKYSVSNADRCINMCVCVCVYILYVHRVVARAHFLSSSFYHKCALSLLFSRFCLDSVACVCVLYAIYRCGYVMPLLLTLLLLLLLLYEIRIVFEFVFFYYSLESFP